MGGPNCLDWAYTFGGWPEVINLDWPRLVSAGTLWTAQFYSVDISPSAGSLRQVSMFSGT